MQASMLIVSELFSHAGEWMNAYCKWVNNKSKCTCTVQYHATHPLSGSGSPKAILKYPGKAWHTCNNQGQNILTYNVGYMLC